MSDIYVHITRRAAPGGPRTPILIDHMTRGELCIKRGCGWPRLWTLSANRSRSPRTPTHKKEVTHEPTRHQRMGSEV